MAISGSPTTSSRCWLSRLDGVERVALHRVVHAARVGQVQHRLAAAAERHALVDGGQEAAAPVGVAAAGPLLAGVEDDEARQIARLAAQPVGHPGAEARPAELLRAGVHQDLRRRVVEGVGHHRFDDGDVVRHAGQVRQQLGQFGAALAVPGELELRPQQLRVGVDERGPVAFEQFGRRQRAVVLGQLRLVVEQLQMAGRTGHEQEDDALGPAPDDAVVWAPADRHGQPA